MFCVLHMFFLNKPIAFTQEHLDAEVYSVETESRRVEASRVEASSAKTV